MPTIAFVAGTSTRNRASRALRLRSPRDTPLPLPMNVLLLRWDTKPDKRIRGTFLRPASTRRTSFYAADRARPAARASRTSTRLVAGGRGGYLCCRRHHHGCHTALQGSRDADRGDVAADTSD